LWVKTIREELRPQVPEESAVVADDEPGAAPPGAATQRRAGFVDDEPDDELAAYNRYLAALHRRDHQAGQR
jgi:hypothetical protein